MAPIAVEDIKEQIPIVGKKLSTAKEPLKYSGSLDSFASFDVTPVIGTEYEDIDLAEILKAPNADDLLRDIAIKSMQIEY